jgi:hypothetical protein
LFFPFFQRSTTSGNDGKWLLSGVKLHDPPNLFAPADGTCAYVGEVCSAKYQDPAVTSVHESRSRNRPHGGLAAQPQAADAQTQAAGARPQPASAQSPLEQPWWLKPALNLSPAQRLISAVLDSSGFSLSANSAHLPPANTHERVHDARAALDAVYPGLWAAVVNDIGDHVKVSPERKAEIVRAAAERLGDGLKICTCAGCGIREVQSDNCGWETVLVKELPDCFKLTEEQLAAREALGVVPQIELLPDGAEGPEGPHQPGQIVHLDVRDFVTSYLSSDGARYHLHPKFVTTGDESCMFCKGCLAGVNSRTPSKLSVAGGTDFGSRLPFELSVAEKVLLADVRLYSIVIKVSAPGLVDQQRSALRGHVISFMQNGPGAAVGAIGSLERFNDINQHIRVLFVGPAGDRDALEKRLFARDGPLHIRAASVWNALQLRKALSEQHKDLIIPPFEQLETALAGVQASLRANQTNITDASVVALENDVMNNRNADPAGVRNAQSDGLGHVAVMDSGVSLDTQLKTTLSALQQAVFPPDSEASPTGGEQAARGGEGAQGGAVPVRRDEAPICEYRENHLIIQGAFWWLSLLGKGLGTVKSIVPIKRSRHMLLFYDNRFALDAQFLFTLANQHMRAACARGVTACWRNHPDMARKFEELRQRDGLQDDFSQALREPKGAKAKELLRLLLPLLTVSGRQVPWSALERKYDISMLIAENRFFGTASGFITFSPHDVMGQLVIRLGVVPVDNESFPAIESDLQSRLWRGEVTSIPMGDIPVDLCLKALRARGVANAASTSEIFRLTVLMVTEILFGLLPDSVSRATVPMCQRPKGVFGRPVSMHTNIETSGRQALHGHAAVHGGPTSALGTKRRRERLQKR